MGDQFSVFNMKREVQLSKGLKELLGESWRKEGLENMAEMSSIHVQKCPHETH